MTLLRRALAPHDKHLPEILVTLVVGALCLALTAFDVWSAVRTNAPVDWTTVLFGGWAVMVLALLSCLLLREPDRRA